MKRDKVKIIRGRIGDIVKMVRDGKIIGWSYNLVKKFIEEGMIKRRRDEENKK